MATKKSVHYTLNKTLLQMLEDNRAKLPFPVSMSNLIDRAMAYYLGCLEDYVAKKGKFKVK